MVLLILSMLVCLALAGVVLGMVAVPAQRQGKELLTPTGTKVVTQVRSSAETARQTGATVAQATRKVTPRAQVGAGR